MSDRGEEMGRGGETRKEEMRKEIWSTESEEHCADLTLSIWEEEMRQGRKGQSKMRRYVA